MQQPHTLNRVIGGTGWWLGVDNLFSHPRDSVGPVRLYDFEQDEFRA